NNHMKSNTNFKNKPPKHSNHTQSQPNNTQTKTLEFVQMVKNANADKTTRKQTFIASNPHPLQKRANRLRSMLGAFPLNCSPAIPWTETQGLRPIISTTRTRRI
ncbi:hypothetical protein, partial [Pararhizobium arenae]|uniref:hypothetical protein n=1 Tax=Pararhizobium arenae TaxID=1856850 RepID=UPI001AED04AA